MSEQKKKSLFREKSLEYIDSPEKLDRYLRVTSPGVWALLIAVVVILIGVIGWGIFGSLETKVQAAVVADQSGQYCLVPEATLSSIVDNPVIMIDKRIVRLAPDTLEPIAVSDEMNVYVLLAGSYQVGDIVYAIPLAGDETPLAEGVYKSLITTEKISPISLLLN